MEQLFLQAENNQLNFYIFASNLVFPKDAYLGHFCYSKMSTEKHILTSELKCLPSNGSVLINYLCIHINKTKILIFDKAQFSVKIHVCN